MSTATADAGPSTSVIYRKSLTFCVLPADLGRHIDELKRHYADAEGFEVVVERRDNGERRELPGEPPAGVERRAAHRRQAERTKTAAEVGFDLPRSLRKHADRIICTWRSVPVHFPEALHEADRLLADADSDSSARDELRLLYHSWAYASVSCYTTTRRQTLAVTDRVFDELFDHHGTDPFSRELSQATGRALAGRLRGV
ncbi:MAG: hypothetical protein ACYDHH_05345 [Solirubrobacteraceae bacterium]